MKKRKQQLSLGNLMFSLHFQTEEEYLLDSSRIKQQVVVGKESISLGCGFHVAAQFLPTVERENIDFADYYFKKWNSDLVYMAGKIVRQYFDSLSLSFPKLENVPFTTPQVGVIMQYLISPAN